MYGQLSIPNSKKGFSHGYVLSNTFFSAAVKHHFVTNIYSVCLDVPYGGERLATFHKLDVDV
jgi:hypothetical protein